MSLKSFNTFILFLLVGLTNVYYSYKDHFSEERFLRKQLKGTETELTKVKMEKYLLMD